MLYANKVIDLYFSFYMLNKFNRSIKLKLILDLIELVFIILTLNVSLKCCRIDILEIILSFRINTFMFYI